jgi:Cdc6-like AAA superfamily ATPase
MFVHGIPGTGKTATVRLIMNQLIHSQEYDFNCTI